MREKIFRWVVRNHPVGSVLNKFQLSVRLILFPIDFLIASKAPYDPLCDVWCIHGKRFDGKFLFDLANSQGQLFKIDSIDGVITLERID